MSGLNKYKRIDILGGGIIGITLGTELLRLIKKEGLSTEVHIYEKNAGLGDGNSTKCIESVRPYWGTPEEIGFYQTSINAMKDLTTHFGNDVNGNKPDANLRQTGYHYFFSKEDFEKSLKSKRFFEEQGVPVNYVKKEDIKEINWIDNNFNLSADIKNEDGTSYNIAGLVQVPTAGFVSAGNVIASYRDVYNALGGKLHMQSKVTGVIIKDNKIVAIKYQDVGNGNSGSKEQSVEYVVNAMGAWSDMFNKAMLGKELGITPHRRIVNTFESPEGYDTGSDHGLVILKSRMIRPEVANSNKIWFYYADPREKPGMRDRNLSQKELEENLMTYYIDIFGGNPSFIKNFEDIKPIKGWHGHYADSPDHNPFIGVPDFGIENFAVNTGWSGHGVMGSIAAALAQANNIVYGTEISPKQYTANREIKRVENSFRL